MTGKDVKELIKTISESAVEACSAQGTIVSSVAQVHMEGDFVSSKDGQLVVALRAGSNIPTDPVEAGGEVGWWRRTVGAGNNRVIVTYKIEARTAGHE